MSNNWTRYTIMHKDKKVASVRENGTCTIYSKKFMPFNIYLEDADDSDLDIRLNNLGNFYHWCASRVLTLDRKYAKEIMNSIGQKQSMTDKDRAQIAIAYHGLSLADVYWIKGDREKISFDEIELYHHSLSDAFVDVTLKGKQLTAQNSSLVSPQDIAGDISTMGVAPKAWIRRNGEFYLLKDGDKQEVEAELLASRIAQCFKVSQVKYESDEYGGEKVSKSKLITSLENSIVAIEHVEVYARNRDTDYMDIVMKNDSYGYYMMNIIDYLIGNTDRHWGNWGFYVENKTNKLKELYPLMDFNKAFSSYDTLEGALCQTTRERISQKDAAIEAVKAVGINQIAEAKRDWFADENTWNMFLARLNLLKANSDLRG